MRELRDLVVEHLRAELFGPAGGRDEEIKGRPIWRYLCGILFPYDLELESLEEQVEGESLDPAGDEKLEDPVFGLAYEDLPSSMGISFYLLGAESIRCSIEAAEYVRAKPSGGASAGSGSADQAGEGEDLESAEGEDSEVEGNPEVQGSMDDMVEVGDRDRAVERDSLDTDGLDGIGQKEAHEEQDGGSIGVIWRRRALADQEQICVESVECPEHGAAANRNKSILGDKARLNIVFRPLGDGHLVTVSLINTRKPASNKSVDQVAAMLFQCRFEIEIEQGEIGSYPSIARFSGHREDEELALIYRNRKPYGIGHGCAAIWPSPNEGQPIRAIAAEPLPIHEVFGLTNDISLDAEAEQVLSLQWLADPARSVAEVSESLARFVDAYERWIEKQADLAKSLASSDRLPAGRVLEKQQLALSRIREGCEFLTSESNRKVFQAFRIAQEAMLRQFLWAARRGQPKDLGDGEVTALDPWKPEYSKSPKWRPFQLAYQLLVLESLARADSVNRETLDLLWFPTGGGKTEAYLALAAFEMIHRRLVYGDAGASTAVLMRYTLRLVTSQQFERCATLISVLEWMRTENQLADLGDSPFRLGLWVGGDTTPNRLDSDSERYPGARQLFEERVLEDDPPENPFQLRACPFCGTRIVPRAKSPKTSDYGIRASASSFHMYCPDDRCPFHDELPVSVVDEDLYKRPPTFLIGTIDKFARMTWDADSRVFLGCGSSGDALAPGLIIQDELHLITGPLGTIAGVYEAAIDTVLKGAGVVPKYLAATATIQRAHEQCRSLYAREAFVFPPSGLNVENSFFSREDSDGSGRTFVGVMGNGLYSSLTSLVQVSSAAAQAVTTIPPGDFPARDGYWTQVIYHNSRHELGKTTTMLRDDVRSRLEILQPDESRRREFDSIEELSASLKGSQVSEALERLQVSLPSKNVIDAVACTNMISVGIDVSRLGLMIVKGQPKSTAEYIQATSRIGRDASRPPGIVLTLFTANRPRDRSHYESFQAYHQTLYRSVEPATVTPFSPPARERTLHAALVLAVRHLLGWVESRDAAKFDPADPDIRSILHQLEGRLEIASEPDEVDEILDHLRRLVDEWWEEVEVNTQPSLTFNSGRQFPRLLAQFPSDGNAAEGHWPTLNSMRHVDGEVSFQIRGQREGS